MKQRIVRGLWSITGTRVTFTLECSHKVEVDWPAKDGPIDCPDCDLLADYQAKKKALA